MFKALPLLAAFLLATATVNAGPPVDGITVFNTITVGPKATGNAGTASGLSATNVEGFDFKLNTATTAPTMVVEIWDGFVGTGNGVALYEQSSVINPPFSGITITSNTNSQFDFYAIGVNGQSSLGGDATITITGLDAMGNAVSGATVTGTASVTGLTNFNVSGNAAFQGIFGVRITSPDLVYAFIDNINLLNVNTTLPVALLDFALAKKGNAVAVNWRTPTTQPTKNFQLQHSTNNVDWVALATVTAAEASRNGTDYIYIHNTPKAGYNYYRLLQQDDYGKQQHSSVISINLTAASQLTVYPNPTTGRLFVSLAEAGIVQITNTNGAILLQKIMSAGAQTLELGQLPAGIYRLQSGRQTATFMVQ